LYVQELSIIFDYLNGILGGFIGIILCVFSILLYICLFVYLKKKKPYQSAKNHWFLIITMVFFVMIVYSIEKFSHFGKLESWVAIADNIFSGSIFAVLCFLFWRYEERIKNKYEDTEKLTDDYDELVKRYEKDSLIIGKNSDGTATTYPVICLGEGYVRFMDGREQIIIKDEANDKYQLPVIIENNYSKIFSVHETSQLFNSLNIRAKKMSFLNNVFMLETGRTTYFDSLVTNRASDYEFEKGLSVRKIYEMGPKMTDLESSRLSNHLGFNGFVESSDGYIVFVKRSNKVSIGKRTYGDSIGASLKTAYALDEKGVFTVKKLKKAITKEIEAELKIKEEDIKEIAIIALYRDCVECGKPQFLVSAKSEKSAEDITKQYEEIVNGRVEASEYKDSILEKEQREKGVLEDGSKLLWIKKEDLKYNIVYKSKMICSKDKKAFVEFDKNNNLIKSKTQELNMVPSASASVVLFANSLYLPTIIESFIESKNKNIEVCEDGLFIGKSAIAVIDGCTSKSDYKWFGKTGGRYAKDIICEELAKDISTDCPQEFFESLNNAIRNAITDNHDYIRNEDKPRASIIAYIPSKKEIWSYGDCQCIIDNKIYTHTKQIDVDLSQKRAAILEEEIRKGNTIKNLMSDDVGRKAIYDDLKKQLNYENTHTNMETDYGYPVLNGDNSICEDMIERYAVTCGQEVVLASDGYPILRNTLEQSEEELYRIIKEDPLCFKQYKSTKGLREGNSSFDDRTYIRFKIE